MESLQKGRTYTLVCKIIITAILCLTLNLTCFAMTQAQYNWAQDILKLAYEAKKVTGLPASIVATQLIIESGWGKHVVGNNYFGIKSDGSQPYVIARTYEWEDGKYVEKFCKFRKYNSLMESLVDYGNFIYENPRYAKAIMVKDNPIKYLYAIWEAGYATSPNYAEKVISIAEACDFLIKENWIDQNK